MKGLIYCIIILILILLASYIVISDEPAASYILRTFVVDDNKENLETSYNTKTFEIPQKPSGRTMLLGTYKQTQAARQRNFLYQQRDEEIQKCIDKITKNWKRTYYKRSYEKVYGDEEEEWITTNLFWEREREFYGYDEDEDWHLRWRLRNRALDGEKIC